MTELPPFLVLFLASAVALVTRGRLRGALTLLAPLLGLWGLWTTPHGLYGQFDFLGFELVLFRVDGLSQLFGYTFLAASFLAVTYALHVRDTLQQSAGLAYAASGLGAVFAGDLLTLFVFWELLGLTSVFLVWARKTPAAYAAGMRYLIIQVCSGLLLMVGLMFYYRQTGSLAFEFVGIDGIAGWLILIAFGIKAGFPLLHNWITDAYPEATPTGAVFLSIFTTKVAIYALARGYPGVELLVYVGAVMTCFPLFYALIENDLRRVLAYSMINPLGLMVCGIGVGSALALNGALAHMVVHVFYKSLLFMTMGSVLLMAGTIKGSELGGLYRSMPKTTVLCIVGAMSLSAFPLFSGFVSKAMVVSALLQAGYSGVWLVVMFAAAGIFYAVGIKIPHLAFFGRDTGLRSAEPPKNMLLAMAMAAIVCIFIGVFPAALYHLLPLDAGYSPYDVSHVLTQLQLLFFAALAYVWMYWRHRELLAQPGVSLDAEWLYRKLFAGISGWLIQTGFALDRRIRRVFLFILQRITARVMSLHELEGSLARDWISGNMVAVLVLVLAVMLFWGLVL